MRRRGVLGGWILLAAVLASRSAIASLTVEVSALDGSPVRDAVVSIERIDEASGLVVSREGPATSPERSGPRAVMDQIDLAFEPHVLAVEVGTWIDFPNSDQVRHSIYSFSAARTFEIKLYRGSEVPPIQFGRAGLAVLGCNIHDDMLAYVYVLETKHFAVTGLDGRARIDGVVAARYRVRVRHPRLEESIVLELERSLGADDHLQLTLPSRPPPRAAPREEHEDDLGDVFGALR